MIAGTNIMSRHNISMHHLNFCLYEVLATVKLITDDNNDYNDTTANSRYHLLRTFHASGIILNALHNILHSILTTFNVYFYR